MADQLPPWPPGPGRMVPDDLPEVALVDGGLLAGGRERAWVLPCGTTIAVSAKILEASRPDVEKSMQRLAARHMWLHTQPETAVRCLPAVWLDNEGVEHSATEFLA